MDVTHSVLDGVDRESAAKFRCISRQYRDAFALNQWFSNLRSRDQLTHFEDILSTHHHPDCPITLYPVLERNIGRLNPYFSQLLCHGVEQDKNFEFCRYLLGRSDLNTDHAEDVKLAFLHAVECESSSRMIELLGEQDWAEVSLVLNQAMVHAVRHHSLRVLKDLLDLSGGSLGNENDLFFEACELGFVDAAELLLNRGAEINGDNGRAIVDASADGRETVLDFLLEHGAMMSSDVDGPLWHAIRYDESHCVNILLDAGAVVTDDHRTLASMRGDMTVIRFLNRIRNR